MPERAGAASGVSATEGGDPADGAADPEPGAGDDPGPAGATSAVVAPVPGVGFGSGVFSSDTVTVCFSPPVIVIDRDALACSAALISISTLPAATRIDE